MNELEVTASGFKLFETGVHAEIIRNLQVILTTPKGSLVGDRDFGLNQVWLDSPVPKAMAKMRVDIVKAISIYEPRVKIVKISFNANNEGRISPRVRVKVEQSA